jgi:hypothetical protein
VVQLLLNTYCCNSDNTTQIVALARLAEVSLCTLDSNEEWPFLTRVVDHMGAMWRAGKTWIEVLQLLLAAGLDPNRCACLALWPLSHMNNVGVTQHRLRWRAIFHCGTWHPFCSRQGRM